MLSKKERLDHTVPKNVTIKTNYYDLYSANGTLTPEMLKDRALVEEIVQWLGESAVLSDGSPHVLQSGKIERLDPEDHTCVASISNEEVLAPAGFVRRFLGNVSQSDGMVDLLKEAEKNRVAVLVDESRRMAILTRMKEGRELQNGKMAYWDRLRLFFDDPQMPRPQNSTERTRVVLDQAYELPQTEKNCLYATRFNCLTPSLLKVTVDGKTVLFAAYEKVCKDGAQTHLKISRDGGVTWCELLAIDGVKSAVLFSLEDKIYLLGGKPQSFLLIKMNLAGEILQTVETDRVGGYDYGKPTVIGERIFIPKGAKILSASIRDDLMLADSWTLSETSVNSLVSLEWFVNAAQKPIFNWWGGTGRCFDGSILEGKDGNVYAIYRMECRPNVNYAILLRFSDDGRTLSLLPNQESLIHIPTTFSKLIVRYDPYSGNYICISNLSTMKSDYRTELAKNVLGISVSRDLVNWAVADVILADREMIPAECSIWKNSFHSADFEFDGEDLTILLLEATDGAFSFTDGKYCSFYRMKNFRQIVGNVRIPKKPMTRCSTRYQENLNDGTIPVEYVRDQEFVEILIDRMRGSAAFMIGSSSVLYNGMICKLDRQNYNRVAVLKDGEIWIPAEFANSYFDMELDTKTSVSIHQLARERGYAMAWDSQSGLLVISPPDRMSFVCDGEMISGYSNREFKDRMLRFFQEFCEIEPSNNAEQSRFVLDQGSEFPMDCIHYSFPTYKTCYSPSIISMVQKGKRVLYASYEYCDVRDIHEPYAETRLKRSEDGGMTWEQVASFPRLKFSSFFSIGETLYMVGDQFGEGDRVSIFNESVFLTVYRFREDFTYDSVILTGATASDVFKPQILDGILYLPKNESVVSIPITEDLMVAENWTITDTKRTIKHFINREWFEHVSGKPVGVFGHGDCRVLEGNVAKGPDGKIYFLFRIECMPYANYGVMLRLSEDRKQLLELPNGGSLINLPTTVSRFVIQQDPVTGLYVNVSNLWTLPSVPYCERARNVLGLSFSRDLVNWQVADTVLVDREMMNSVCSVWAHSFQYTDFDFDGEDLVFLSRETVGKANTFHDGKYCTFYRLKNFRDLIEKCDRL